jgi:DNA-directed RNA polymerase subunit RPC12/RpoP
MLKKDGVRTLHYTDIMKDELEKRFKELHEKTSSFHEYSVEKLYHFKCGFCGLWWSIGDWKPRDLITCPHCTHKAFLKELLPVKKELLPVKKELLPVKTSNP